MMTMVLLPYPSLNLSADDDSMVLTILNELYFKVTTFTYKAKYNNYSWSKPSEVC